MNNDQNNKTEPNYIRINREETKPTVYKAPTRELSNSKIMKTTQSSESFQKIQNSLNTNQSVNNNNNLGINNISTIKQNQLSRSPGPSNRGTLRYENDNMSKGPQQYYQGGNNLYDNL